MNRIGIACLSAALCGVVSAGEVLPMYGGQLEVPDAGVTLYPAAFLPGWRGVGASGGLTRDVDGRVVFTMWTDKKDKNAARLDGRASFKNVDDAVRVSYAITPDKDVEITQLYLSARFDRRDYAGGTVAGGGVTRTIPVGSGETQFFMRTVKDLAVRDKTGRMRLALTFDHPVFCMFQDDRTWGGDTVSLRVFFGSDKPFKAGKTYAVSFRLTDGAKTALAGDADGVKIVAGTNWIPMKVEADILPGSALDFSKLRGTDAPAGRHGYPVARGQNFEFERLPGVPQRFYGVNVCASANTPDPETAAAFARRLARVGYNAIRFHHHERDLVQNDGVSLDPEKMACFDALVAACVSNGIYMTTDLYVSRNPIAYRSIGIDLDGTVGMDEFKELVQVHEGAFQNYLRFARAFLGHVNPYTGRSLAQEPALGWLSFVNEGNLGNKGMEFMQKHPVFRDKWQTWLAAKKVAEPSAYANVPDTLPPDLAALDNPHVRAYTLFLADVEAAFAARVTKFLREEMKCRALTTNMNNWHYPAAFQLPRANSYDYVDDHFYVDHPRFLESPWRLPSQCPNANPMLGANRGAQRLVARRVLDRPFTITEYNYSAPGRFRGVGGIACGTAAALQNWAGLWRFAWSHDATGVKGPKAMNYFDMSGDPLGLASERASICLFLRRDLEPLAKTYAMVLPPRKLASMGPTAMMQANWVWAGWYAKVGGVVADAAPADAMWQVGYPECFTQSADDVRRQMFPTVADGKALPPAGDGAVEIDSETGRFILKTARTCGGFAEGGVVRADALVADIGGTPATVWASSLDGKPLRESAHVLVTHLTDVQNSNIRYGDRHLRILLDWGRLPHVMRAGRADVTAAVLAGKWTVYALATNGARRRTVPAAWTDAGLSFTANVAFDPADATYLYELVRE